jgi:hypothetical protein
MEELITRVRIFKLCGRNAATLGCREEGTDLWLYDTLYNYLPFRAWNERGQRR